MTKIYQPLKIIFYIVFYYLAVDFYIFAGTIVLLFVLYWLTEWWTDGLLNHARDLMDEESKAKFDQMSKDQKLKALDCRNYDDDFLYIRDTLKSLYYKIMVFQKLKLKF
jgi:hypothetical protein